MRFPKLYDLLAENNNTQVVYHVSPFTADILRDGRFKLDKQGTMFGAGDSGGYVSTTPDLKNARLYRSWMAFLRRLAMGDAGLYDALDLAFKVGARGADVYEVLQTATSVLRHEQTPDALWDAYRGDRTLPVRDEQRLAKQFTNSLSMASRGSYAPLYLGATKQLADAPEPQILEVQAQGEPLGEVPAEKELRFAPDQLDPVREID